MLNKCLLADSFCTPSRQTYVFSTLPDPHPNGQKQAVGVGTLEEGTFNLCMENPRMSQHLSPHAAGSIPQMIKGPPIVSVPAKSLPHGRPSQAKPYCAVLQVLLPDLGRQPVSSIAGQVRGHDHVIDQG